MPQHKLKQRYTKLILPERVNSGITTSTSLHQRTHNQRYPNIGTQIEAELPRDSPQDSHPDFRYTTSKSRISSSLPIHTRSAHSTWFSDFEDPGNRLRSPPGLNTAYKPSVPGLYHVIATDGSFWHSRNSTIQGRLSWRSSITAH